MRYGSVPWYPDALSRFVLGTSRLVSVAEPNKLLDSIYDMGCNVADTARIYSNGNVERILGAWLKERGLQHRFTVITKGGHPLPGEPNRLTTDAIRKDVEASLRELQLDAIDIFLLHRDNSMTPIDELLGILNDLVQDGKIRAFGTSNWTAARLIQAETLVRKRHDIGFSINSPQVSLWEWTSPPWDGCVSLSGSSITTNLLRYSVGGVPIFGWSSLAAGLVREANAENIRNCSTGILGRRVADVYRCRANIERLNRARELAEKRGLGVPQIALAYLLNQPVEIYPIFSSSSPEHFSANLGAFTVALSTQEREWLNLERNEMPQ